MPSIRDVRTLEREGVRGYADKSGQGKEGGLAVCGHPFQGRLCKREEGI